MNDRATRRLPPRRRAAFTIIEVLATMTLAGIILPVAIHGLLICLATGEVAAQRAEATSLAQTKMAELVATGLLYENELAGDFGEDWPEYQWVAQMADWEDSRLRQLDVYVTWTRRGREHAVTVSTLVYMGSSS